MIKESNEVAFQVLFERLWERMLTLAFGMLKNRERAQDIVQEVWIDIWERRNTIEIQNIEAYILRATRFSVYKELRDTKSTVISNEFLNTLATPITENILEKIYAQESENKIDKLVKNLPPKCNQIFVLSRYKGFANSEISAMLNISQRTVETHISNALFRLKKELSTYIIFLLIIFL